MHKYLKQRGKKGYKQGRKTHTDTGRWQHKRQVGRFGLALRRVHVSLPGIRKPQVSGNPRSRAHIQTRQKQNIFTC